MPVSVQDGSWSRLFPCKAPLADGERFGRVAALLIYLSLAVKSGPRL